MSQGRRLPCLGHVLADIFRAPMDLQPSVCGKLDILGLRAEGREQHAVCGISELASEAMGPPFQRDTPSIGLISSANSFSLSPSTLNQSAKANFPPGLSTLNVFWKNSALFGK
jgi:hypothetical protein